MKSVYATVELLNAVDAGLAKRDTTIASDVKRLSINVKVNSHVWMIAINNIIQAQLDLPFVEKQKAQMAGGDVVEYEVVGPLMINFENRTATCNAFVLPGDSESLLGVIPMEEMDVFIHPQTQELIVNPEHPNYAQLKM